MKYKDKNSLKFQRNIKDISYTNKRAERRKIKAQENQKFPGEIFTNGNGIVWWEDPNLYTRKLMTERIKPQLNWVRDFTVWSKHPWTRTYLKR